MPATALSMDIAIPKHQTAILRGLPSIVSKALAVPSSKRQIAKSHKRIGEGIKNKPWAPVWAKLVAEGSRPKEALRAAGGPRSASSAALLHHPQIRTLVLAHLMGPTNFASAFAVEGLLVTRYLMHNAENDKIRLEAAQSMMDRGGIPRTSEIRVDARVEATNTIQAILDAPTQVLEADSDVIEVEAL